MLISLTQSSTQVVHDFFSYVLSNEDGFRITGSALPLLCSPNPFAAQGYILDNDAKKLGGTPHESWQILSEIEWVDLVAQHEKHITW